MELQKNYTPGPIEDKWYQYWIENKIFHSEPDEREPYTIVIPPPNVTGVLHMGHLLNNTIQDVLVRKARMENKNACWVPGTDHASIATESKVVQWLAQQGIDKSGLTREEFLKYAWEWKEKHGGIIIEQLKKLGASCDWDRIKFTMDPDMSESVIKVFVKLFRKGLIYRGARMINWDPQAKTAVSDEEVVYKEVQSKLYYVKYFLEDKSAYLPVATTRPETILGDTAVCVHPEDERYKQFVGKRVIVPMVNRVVPVIADEYVDREFGTGALKITPAHDINDYEIGLKYNLPEINIFNEDGTINKEGGLFIGVDRFEARKLAVELLKKENCLIRVEDYTNKVGFSERTDAVIEPRISTQWFLKMKELTRPALESVLHDEIKFHPSKFKNIYRHWMENVKDWCISRQLWWGHRIPAWYLPDGSFVVAENEIQALELARNKKGFENITTEQLHQDEDVLDTWFSSWLWPISVFDGIRNPDNPDIRYYYPTNDLITAPDIIFFWVARMIMAGYEFMNEKPFHNVYFTGIVRDNKRRKMSKSLGNSPEPLELIEKYGADGVRVGMLLSSPAGNDLLFDESLCEQGRNFNNKIWNAFRLVSSWEVDPELQPSKLNLLAVEWLESLLNKNIHIVNDHYSKYRISDALMTLYKLFWNEFSAWYLEAIKPAPGEKIDKFTQTQTTRFFETLLKLLHPFIPFITEELYHHINHDNKGFIANSKYPEAGTVREDKIFKFEFLKELVSKLRDYKNAHQIPLKKKIKLITRDGSLLNPGEQKLVEKLAGLSSVEVNSTPSSDSIPLVVQTYEFFIPAEKTDKEAELKKLTQELEYY
ncbi:MAG: valine--tRNA ligase, partial [Calditrichaeota bacterium]